MNIWRKCLFIKKNKKTEKILYKIEECDKIERPKEPEKFREYDDSSDGISIFAAAFLVLLMVVTIVYSLYTFMHVTGLSDLAGVHVTASLRSAAEEIIYGKTTVIPGYEGWLTYRGTVFDFEYPADWTVQELNKERSSIELRKYSNTARRGFDSLVATVYFNEMQGSDDSSIEDILKKEGVLLNETWKEATFAGKQGVRTGKVKTDTGIIKDFIFWKIDDKMYWAEIDYLNADIANNEAIFEKIVAQLKFI